MKNGDTGHTVKYLQLLLNQAGLKVEQDGWFGPATEAAVKAIQARAGLVVDGIAGPKTIAALASGDRNPKHLSEADLEKAAERLGVPVAAIKAVNEVESRGQGFLNDGRPVILYERHIAFRLLGESGMPFDEACALAERYPNLVSQKRGGYVGGAAEYERLANALQILPADIGHSACSWGQFQIMGYHWQDLGYQSCAAFVADMQSGEDAQLAAFTAFILADTALHKALKARKWADFARIYNGPAYKDNLYDVKLARAFERHSPAQEKEAA